MPGAASSVQGAPVDVDAVDVQFGQGSEEGVGFGAAGTGRRRGHRVAGVAGVLGVPGALGTLGALGVGG